jgi:hypothetical protein
MRGIERKFASQVGLQNQVDIFTTVNTTGECEMF